MFVVGVRGSAQRHFRMDEGMGARARAAEESEVASPREFGYTPRLAGPRAAQRESQGP